MKLSEILKETREKIINNKLDIRYGFILTMIEAMIEVVEEDESYEEVDDRNIPDPTTGEFIYEQCKVLYMV